VGAPEGVDTLRVVSHDRDVAVRLAHSAKNPRLQHVRILILVDEDVVVETGDLLPKFRRGFEQQGPEEQKIVVVDEIALLLPARVICENLSEILEVIDELRIIVANYVVDRNTRVDVSRVDVL
jgi:hypothetical protein